MKIPELLAPAGNLECALEAFENGADAVYAGLTKFNAREKSDNFSLEDMARLSSYALKHRKKIYLTLNTLVKERELEEVYRDLEEISRLNIDAVIVQDIGITRLVREFFPELSIHASTQMGIHNSAGIRQAQAMGISRVILERQVTIDELELISSRSSLEIEVFIHGALCCSLSGNCLFSSWIGGWSGNRGKCKQPCRRRYYSKKDGNGFFFSTKDLYTLDLIPELKRIGVDSVKIEGRLKNADYVGRTVSAYRMILDAQEGASGELIGRAKTILAGSGGRKWSSGFYTEESLKTVVDHTTIGVSGQLCGELVSVTDRGITVKVSREIKLKDRLRIQPKSADDGPQITVSSMKNGNRTVNRARKNDRVLILTGGSGFLKDISPGSLVFKVGRVPDKLSIDPETIPIMTPVRVFNLGIRISRQGFEISYRDFQGTPSWIKEMDIETAEKHGITSDTVKAAFKATRNSGIKAGKLDIEIDGNLFIPSGVLKKVRREFWEYTEGELETSLSMDNSSRNIDNYIRYHFSSNRMIAGNRRESGSYKTFMVNSCGEAIPGIGKDDHKAVPLSAVGGAAGDGASEAVLPVFTGEKNLEMIADLIKEAYKRGIRRFRARSLYQMDLLKGYPDIHVTAAYPLPASNSLAVRELAHRGAGCVQGWVELEKQALEDLINFSPVEIEVYRYGRPHILATRAQINVEGDITDSHGVEFIVKKDHNEEMTFIYGSKVMSIPHIPGTSDCFDLTNSKLSEKQTTDFNFNKEWI